MILCKWKKQDSCMVLFALYQCRCDSFWIFQFSCWILC